MFSDYPDLEVCVYAAPTQTVIGGPPEQVDAIIARAEAEGKFARKFQTRRQPHQQMGPLLGELAAGLQGIEARPLQTAYYSTVREGSLIRAGAEPIHDVDYWKKGLRHGVYFTHGIRNAVDNGHTTFLELAPNPVALMQVGLTTASAGSARRAARRDAGPQAGRSRLDDDGHGPAVHPRSRPGLPHPVLPRRICRHPADAVQAQAALARRPVPPVTAPT